MKMRWKSLLTTVVAVATLTAGTLGVAQAADKDKTITLGWTSWASTEFTTKLVKTLIEENTDYDVNLKMAAIGVQYQGVANGDLDGMTMAWLPETHKDYWKKFKDQVVDLGPIFDDAKLGWVVPDYIPRDELDSIEDLKKESVQKRLKGKVQGIDPGAGLMQLSGDAMKAYDLEDDYELVSASDSAMTAALAKAEKNEDWIVVTGWTPHWKFGKWDLRFLKDPKGELGAEEHSHVIVREGFKKDHPKVAEILSNINIPIDELMDAMYDARKTSYEEAIHRFIDEHEDEVDEWLGKADDGK